MSENALECVSRGRAERTQPYVSIGGREYGHGCRARARTRGGLSRESLSVQS